MLDGRRYERRAEIYLARLGRATDRSSLPRSDAKHLFDEFLALTEMPHPAAHLEPWFWNRTILKDLARSVHLPFNERLRAAVDEVAPHDPGRYRLSFLRVRRLSPLGRYPNRQHGTERAQYFIYHGEPYLVTVNSRREEDAWGFGGGMGDWSRHETRLATAIGTVEAGGWLLFMSHHCYDLPVAYMDHVDPAARVSFAIELATLRRRIREKNERSIWKPFPDTRDGFEFGDYSAFEKDARTFANAFLVSHPVLLRTSRYYVKSQMLWRADGFEEDAVASLFFALEGCLLLFQEIAGERTDKLDRRALRRIFPEVYERGEWIYDWIENALGWGGLRAQLVHPELALIDGWKPLVQPDDYYEYSQTVRAFLTYAVTGSTHEDYPLAGSGPE